MIAPRTMYAEINRQICKYVEDKCEHRQKTCVDSWYAKCGDSRPRLFIRPQLDRSPIHEPFLRYLTEPRQPRLRP
jgi:hypothetical protein